MKNKNRVNTNNYKNIKQCEACSLQPEVCSLRSAASSLSGSSAMGSTVRGLQPKLYSLQSLLACIVHVRSAVRGLQSELCSQRSIVTRGLQPEQCSLRSAARGL